MAIRVLRDHDVPEENIIFLTFLAASAGLHVLANAFPKVKIVTSMVDPVLSPETLWIEPGIGNFGGMSR
jgi:uridine kinase